MLFFLAVSMYFFGKSCHRCNSTILQLQPGWAAGYKISKLAGLGFVFHVRRHYSFGFILMLFYFSLFQYTLADRWFSDLFLPE
jgi:hypothetical protein